MSSPLDISSSEEVNTMIGTQMGVADGWYRGVRKGVKRSTTRDPRLLADDVFGLVFLDRPGSYILIDKEQRHRRPYSKEEIIESLRSYYRVLLHVRGDGDKYEGWMTTAEIKSWWGATTTLRHHMQQWWVNKEKPYDLNYYTAFLSAFYRLDKKTMDAAFFTALTLYIPLVLSSYLCIMPSPSLTILHFHNAVSHSTRLMYGVVALKPIRMDLGKEAKQLEALQGSLVRISKQQFEQLQDAGQSHCLMVSYHMEKPLLTGRKRREAADCRSRRYASRERSKEQQHVAKQPRRSPRIATTEQWKEGLLAEAQWIDESVELEAVVKNADDKNPSFCCPTESHDEDEKDVGSTSKNGKRRRGRPITQRRELQYYIVVGGISFVNEACVSHANLVPYGQRGPGEERLNQWHEASMVPGQHLRARREVAFQYEDGRAEQRQCIWCGVQSIVANANSASGSAAYGALRATAIFLGWCEKDVHSALQAR
jgi:hypothetical protein